jgi:hypothetical protein
MIVVFGRGFNREAPPALISPTATGAALKGVMLDT